MDYNIIRNKNINTNINFNQPQIQFIDKIELSMKYLFDS